MRLLIIALLISINSYALTITDNMLDSIALIESNRKLNVIGDNGKSVGCLQIQQKVLDDVYRIQYKLIKQGRQKTDAIKYTRNDCFNKDKSYKIAKIYLKYYGEIYERKYHRPATFQVLFKIWNAGPNWF